MKSDLQDNIRELLNLKYKEFNTRAFIKTDPVQIPHSFNKKEDIEISSFLTCTIAWGKRQMIIKNAFRLMNLMDNSPYDFLQNSSGKEWDMLGSFVHRTFQPIDLMYFLDALRRIYRDHGGLEEVFNAGYKNGGIFESLIEFRRVFMQWSPPERTNKHVSNPEKGSAAKRLNLFLMWMVRKDDIGVHFGLWPKISMADLIIPLDVHVGRVSRSLGLLTRSSNDWRAANELTSVLRQFDSDDPVKYDFSLFGMGLEKSV
jgi:uncharacterized protein (TIGR02757 family)